MTDRARRQRRLLAVRSLEADLAAAHLRKLHGEQDELRLDMTHWQSLMRTQPHETSTVPAHGEWLLSCAEQEIAQLRAADVSARMDGQAALIETQTNEERERRVAREQMQRLCDRTEGFARAIEERTVQARLDDIFSAARLRRMMENATGQNSDEFSSGL